VISVVAPDGVPEVRPGDDLAALLLAALAPYELSDGDVVLVTSKVVSKAEGRLVPGADRDAVLPAETSRVVARRGPTTIVRNRLGLTMAAAGIDNSNVPLGSLALLPLDPDGSARALRAALAATANVAVVVTDTAGRAWRTGQTDIAIGAAGLLVLEDHAGRTDGYGNPLVVTAPAVADELASAAELAQGKLGARPFALVRGRADLVLPPGSDGPGAVALQRAEGEDLFGYGAREAVVRALAGAPADRAPFGAPAAAAEVADAVQRVLRVTPVNADGALVVPVWEDARLSALAFAFGWEVEPGSTRDSVIRPRTP
jgi:coenzyme F420-0:L-glutamate ligase / coenzyme F420-1:gamma-L-glutamate ligase